MPAASLATSAPGGSHRKPDVGSRQGGIAVRTVTGDTNNFTESGGFQPESSCPQGRTGQVPETVDELEMLVRVESAENEAFHDDVASGVDAAQSDDRASDEDVVSDTHLDGDTACRNCSGSRETFHEV